MLLEGEVQWLSKCDSETQKNSGLKTLLYTYLFRRRPVLTTSKIMLTDGRLVIFGTHPLVIDIGEIEHTSVGFDDYFKAQKSQGSPLGKPLKIKLKNSIKYSKNTVLYLLIDFDGVRNDNELWHKSIQQRMGA